MHVCGKKNQATQPKPYSGVDLNEGTTESNQATVPGLASTGPHSAQELYLNAWTEGEGTTMYVLACVSHNSGHDQLAGMLRNSTTS